MLRVPLNGFRNVRYIAVGRDLGAGDLGIAEEQLAVDERRQLAGWGVLPGSRDHRRNDRDERSQDESGAVGHHCWSSLGGRHSFDKRQPAGPGSLLSLRRPGR